jgi:hypothetical protein
MKTSLTLWAIAIALALFTLISSAAEPTPTPVPPDPAPAAKSWWTQVSVSPYGAIKHHDLSGKAIWGAGLDLGWQVNRVVGIHLGNSIFDYPDRGRACWGGSAIDESEILGRADLIRGGGPGRDRFLVYGLGSYTRDWEADDNGFGLGGGASLRLSKNIAIEGDYRVRAFFREDKDGIARLLFSLKF